MGPIRLLTRQGEIQLAKGMERGKFHTEKALSRSPLVWRSALSTYNEARQTRLRSKSWWKSGPPKGRNEVTRRLGTLARLDHQLQALEQKIEATPERHVKVLAKLERESLRLSIRCSQELRAIPFKPYQWRQFRDIVESAAMSDRTARRLMTAVRRGEAETEAAKAALVEANLRLVVRWLKSM